MSNLGKMIRIAGFICGLGLLFGSAMAGEGSKVIRDGQWTIKIRSSNGNARSVNVDVSNFRSTRVTPAVYQQPEAAPAPESVKPAVDAVQPAPTPAPVDPKSEEQLPAGPKLNPDSVGSPLELVPNVVSPSVMTYEEAYAAVKFSRTEYEANPTYRHQAALELMFRTLRPTTLVQNYTPRAFRYPDSYQLPYARSDTQHINIRNFGGGTNYNGQSPFGYPYGLHGNW